jgi:hypothetical protein
MAIPINEESNYVAYPIVKHQKIGQSAKLCVIRWEQRARLMKDQVTNQLVKIPNGQDRNGNPKFKQELVIHCITAGGDMVAAIGDKSSVPLAGDRVRIILKGLSFGEWIEARKKHRNGAFHVGDGIILTTTHAQQYDGPDAPRGAKITTQAEADAVPRNVTMGFYGSLELVPSEADWAQPWVEKAEEAYTADKESERKAINLAQAIDEEEGDI